jgi:hypothetical protein
MTSAPVRLSGPRAAAFFCCRADTKRRNSHQASRTQGANRYGSSGLCNNGRSATGPLYGQVGYLRSNVFR